MPEGPEVKQTATVLQKKLEGKTVISIDVLSGSRMDKYGFKGLDYFHPGMKLDSVSSKGKKIIFQMSDPSNESDVIYLVGSFGMTGRWQYTNHKHAAIVLTFGHIKRMKKCKLIISTNRVYYVDQRHMGDLKIIKTQAEWKDYFKDVGPDLLAGEVTYDMYYDLVKKKAKHGTTSKMLIGMFIKENKYFSGVGNYLRAEILYKSAISPYRTLKELSDEDIQILYNMSIETINQAYECNGLTISDFWDPDNTLGTYDTLVYGKKTDPNGEPIVKEMDNKGQAYHWVPTVQV